MDQTSITAAGAIDTFLVLLIGIGPKIALVPFVEITASLDPAAKQRVLRKMLTTAAAVAVILMVLGELLRALLHFTIGSLSIAGGVILLVLAVWMVLSPPASGSDRSAGKDPMQLAQFPLAVPYLLNPVGIVGLMTISAEADSVSVFAVEFGILVFVLLLDVVVFRWANRVSDKLDESRMLVTEKVFGFLIAAVAVQLFLDGLASEGIIGACPALSSGFTRLRPMPWRTGRQRPAVCRRSRRQSPKFKISCDRTDPARLSTPNDRGSGGRQGRCRNAAWPGVQRRLG